MADFGRRLDFLETLPACRDERAQERIEAARRSGDFASLSDSDLQIAAEDEQRLIAAHPAEWEAFCASLVGEIGEHAAQALADSRFDLLSDSELEQVRLLAAKGDENVDDPANLGGDPGTVAGVALGDGGANRQGESLLDDGGVGPRV